MLPASELPKNNAEDQKQTDDQPSSKPQSRSETHFHAPVEGQIHTGSGDINITNHTPLLSLAALREGLDHIFKWSEADEHMRSSWAGMVIWSLTAVTKPLTPQFWLSFLTAFALWIATGWLLTPILQWPLDDLQGRLIACIKFASATILIPLIIALVTPVERPFLQTTWRQRNIIFRLKLAGALVGFTAFAVPLLVPALALYYFGLSPTPAWLWYIFGILPLLFSYVTARRIPADRHKMYGNEPTEHSADKLFRRVFYFVGSFVAGFLYFWHDYLAMPAVGFLLLLVFIGIALHERRKAKKKAAAEIPENNK